jgi:hypothetical protein
MVPSICPQTEYCQGVHSKAMAGRICTKADCARNASRLLVLFSLVFCDFFDGIPGSAPGMVPQLRLTATDHLLVDLDVSSQLWRASIHSGHFTH